MRWLVAVLVAVATLSLVGSCARSGDEASLPATDAPAAAGATTTKPAAADPTAAPTTATASTTVEVPTTSAPVADPRALVAPSGVVVTVLGTEAGGVRVRTPCFGQAVVTDGRPLGPADVVLDPGHGGDETGAVGANGLTEKEVNLLVASETRDRLEAAGYSVVLTRTGDYRTTLQTRAELATSLGARAFVSIHHNAAPDGPWPGPGSETYYQITSAESRRLAGLVYEEVLAAFTPYDVSWVADTDAGAKYRRNDEGGDYYGILRRSAGVPATLSEAAFITNPPEAALLATPEFRAAEAEALARAVQRFLETDDPGSGFVEPYPRTEPAGPGGGLAGCEDPPL